MRRQPTSLGAQETAPQQCKTLRKRRWVRRSGTSSPEASARPKDVLFHAFEGRLLPFGKTLRR